MRLTWEDRRPPANPRPFESAADFFAAASVLDLRTPVYVDAELGNGVDGAAQTRRIHDLGFTEVYLATGHDAARFAGLTNLRGVVGKEPPW